MSDRIAIKRLTASDCTFFQAVHKIINAGHQKSINLNADVLTGQFYPGLAAAAAATDNEIPLPISIYGPAAKGAHKLTRKITKVVSSKNWRLNGEVVPGPPGDTARYDEMQPGDIAILVFKGDPIPTGADLILVGQANAADTALHAALLPLFGNKSMIAVTPSLIAETVSNAAIPEVHPVYVAAADPELDAALEDAALGGFEGASKLVKKKGGKKVSASELAKAKAKAEQIGQHGEGLVNAYLARKVAEGQLDSYVWASSENAFAPYDFDVTSSAKHRTLIDAKTSGGSFNNAIHLSLGEIIEAAGDIPYCIYRVFDIDESGAKLCISDDIRPLAKALKGIHEAHIPKGIRVDGFSVQMDVLKWSPEQYVELPEEDEAA